MYVPAVIPTVLSLDLSMTTPNQPAGRRPSKLAAALQNAVTWVHRVLYRSRYLWTDGRALPSGQNLENLGPAWYGHSVANWNGDTLIVNTVGLDGVLNPPPSENSLESSGPTRCPAARLGIGLLSGHTVTLPALV